MTGVAGNVGSMSSSAIAASAQAMSGSYGSNGSDVVGSSASRGGAVVGANAGSSIGPNIDDGSNTSTVVPGLPCDSVTVTPWRVASSDTTDMPSVGSTDRPTIGGSRRSSFSSVRRSLVMPTPLSTMRSMYESPARRPPNAHDAVGRAERGGVVEQFGQQVRHVGDDVAAHLQVLERLDLDPAIVLDLADRGANDVVDLGRLDPAALGLGVGEHQQRLAVAAHAGSHVVELVVVRQHVGVVDLGLELVEHRELAVDQRPVAAGHRDEDVRHAAAQHVDLLVGDVDECGLHRVERLGPARPARRCRAC